MYLNLKSWVNHIGEKAKVDLFLLGVVLLLLVIGLLMVSSASMELSYGRFGTPFSIIIKQMVYVLLGIVSLFSMLYIPISKIEEFSWLLLFTALFLLVFVLFFGKEVNGSIRWIRLYIFNLQVSELAKLLIVLYLASYLVRKQQEIRTHWIGFVKPMLVLTLSAFLLLLEPDFGSVVVLMGASLCMIFMAGAPLFPLLVFMFILGVSVVALVLFEPYRLARITAYMDPWADAFGSGYQLTQSLIAFGRGEFFGQGLGNSIQKLFYLPEVHTDFVFAVIGEEFGAVGSLVVLCLFLTIGWRSLNIGAVAQKQGLLFHGFVAFGLGMMFVSQAFINMGVSMGLLPTKGMVLPLISYGGSSLLVNCTVVGVLLRIDYECRLKSYRLLPKRESSYET